MLFLFVLGCVLLQQASGFIESLTDDELNQLPALFQLDKYYECLRKPGDKYCNVDAYLVGNASNEVFHTLQEYSALGLIHFNRTLIHRGVCVNSCADYFGPNLTESLETCLNATLEKEYQLNARVTSMLCTDYEPVKILDNSDYVFMIVTLVVLVLNVLGSAYDFYAGKGRGNIVSKFLLCFAIRRNWEILVTNQGGEQKMKRLKCLSGFRTISTFLVILGHSPLPGLMTSHNPDYLERTYQVLPFQVLYSGTLIVQTFFIISGLLQMFTSLVGTERSPITWKSFPSGILNRWLRMTPPYAFVMFFVMTVGRRVGDGPFWMTIVEVEAVDCQSAWWHHLLYIQNYFDHNQCMAHAWYLAADFQLTVVGLTIACALSSTRAQKLGVAAIFAAGLLTPAAHVFFQNLHAILIVSPEMALNLFVNDETFNNLYKRGHTNLSCYAIGLGLAFVIYNLKDSDIGAQKYKKFRLFYWMLFPIELALVLTGATFYIAGIEVPLGVRMVYASAIKVLFGGSIALHILFTILKIDKVHRGVLNWGGWAIIAKVSYCAYLVHVCVLRTSAANNDGLSLLTTYKLALNYMAMLGASFAIGTLLYFLVESPCSNVTKTFIFPKRKRRDEKTKSVSMVADITASKETIEAKI